MKTDPFDDAIRRKLEGITPTFQDKNWTQFQRFMSTQGFPPSLWQTPARWLQPALTAAAVAGMLITTIWQYRTNQSLTTHVQTLTQTVERMERAQLRLQQSVAMMAGTPRHVDTVYLAAPATASSRSGLPPAGILAMDLSVSDEVPALRPAPPNVLLPNLGTLATERTGRSHQTIMPQERLPQAFLRQTDSPPDRARPDRASVSSAEGSNPLSRRTSVDRPPTTVAPTYPASPGVPLVSTPGSGRASASLATNERTASSHLRTQTQPSNDETRSTLSVTNLPPTGAAPAASNALNDNAPVSAATGQPATVQPLTLRPLVAATDAFDANWQRHLRRVRYRSPYTTPTQTSLPGNVTTPAQRREPVPVQLRVGLGGEASTAQTGLGLYAEAIIANRWTIGTGLTSVSWVGDEYTNEQQFTAKTKRDFRYTYPGSAPPMPVGPSMPRQLVDISRSAQSLVIPVQLGYRLGLGSFVLTPAVGLNMALNARETVTYGTDRQPGFDDVRQSVSVARPQSWYTNWTIGVGAERQWGQFAGQVSPVLYVPFQANNACLNIVSAGVRARLYYRF